MSLRDHLASRIDGSLKAIRSLSDHLPTLVALIDRITLALKAGGTLYTAGNGGSAAQAMHLAEELIGRYRTGSPRRPCRAICLNADPTALTCIANDFGYEHVFARQCEALISEGDVLLVLSTSGNSANIVNALTAARERGGTTIGLLGRDGGEAAVHCDHALIVPDSATACDSAHIQEAHQVLIHLICEAVEQTSLARQRM